MDLVDRYGPWALVLGASEGLGAAWARGLAKRGLNVIVAARRKDKLQAVASDVEGYGVQTRIATLDLADPNLESVLEATVDGLDVGLVVYNACYSVIGEFTDLSLEQKLMTVDVNVRGPVVAAHVFAPKLIDRGRGGLVFMSSMSGFQGTAMVGTYAATKAFDTVLGETLWEELGRHGVDAMVCAAGAILTPNFEGQTPESKRGTAYPMQPDAVVEEAIAQLGRGKPTVIPGGVNRLASTMFGLLPRKTAVRMISRNTRSMYGDSE